MGSRPSAPSGGVGEDKALASVPGWGGLGVCCEARPTIQGQKLVRVPAWWGSGSLQTVGGDLLGLESPLGPFNKGTDLPSHPVTPS